MRSRSQRMLSRLRPTQLLTVTPLLAQTRQAYTMWVSGSGSPPPMTRETAFTPSIPCADMAKTTTRPLPVRGMLVWTESAQLALKAGWLEKRDCVKRVFKRTFDSDIILKTSYKPTKI